MIKITHNYQKNLNNIKFIDLFAGIGGFRLALESFGAKCVFSCEINKNSCLTYEKNFNENPFGDIRQISLDSIQKYSILCAGFPCQAFSISGKRKGLEDERSDVIFSLLNVISHHKPPILFLENVPNLLAHEKGKTFNFLVENLKKLNYQIEYQILDASDYQLAQNRKRLFILGFHKETFTSPIKYAFPQILPEKKTVRDILEVNGNRTNIKGKIINWLNKISHNVKKYTKPHRIGTINKGGQGERIYSIDAPAITLSASSGGSAPNTGAYLINNNIRGLTPRECARLQGFPDNFIIPVTEKQALQQFGNSLPVNIVQYIIKSLIEQGIIGILSKKNKNNKWQKIKKTEISLLQKDIRSRI